MKLIHPNSTLASLAHQAIIKTVTAHQAEIDPSIFSQFLKKLAAAVTSGMVNLESSNNNTVAVSKIIMPM